MFKRTFDEEKNDNKAIRKDENYEYYMSKADVYTRIVEAIK